MSKLPERLRSLRKNLNKTQKEMAKLLEVSQSTYSAYETGVYEPNSDTIIKIADFFDVSSDYLLGRIDIKATQAEVDFVNELETKGLDQLIHEYNLTLGNEMMDPKEERMLIRLMKAFMEEDL
ncbi:MAG: helix-turn-helix domain-containing protein [Candidatus Izimaplasma sp.]|nr:helix-turn-helix domain-containing protein [Candidatus Izimaplasma bacterium]